MYNFLIDADALIKLAHSGALIEICNTFNCLTTDEVKKEVIDEGKKRLYPDVYLIESLVNQNMIQVKELIKYDNSMSLGKGESAILSLSREIKNSIIVSDDKTFINEVERNGIDFLVPVDLIILLKYQTNINSKDIDMFLEKIKPFIREKDYKKAKEKVGGKK